MPEKPLPHNPEAELGLISILINYPEKLDELSETGITPEMLFSYQAGHILTTYLRLTQEAGGNPPSLFSMTQTLRHSEPEYAYFKRATTEVFNRTWFNRYAGIVLDCYQKRQYIRLSAELAGMAYDTTVSADACGIMLEGRSHEIETVARPLTVLGQQTLVDRMEQYYQESQKRREGIDWGLRDFDRSTRGTRLGEYTVLIADKGSGKSSLIHQVAYYRATCEFARPQLIITVGDMTAEQIMTRIQQQLTGVTALDQSFGRYRDRDRVDRWQEIDRNLHRFSALPFYIAEASGYTSTDVKRLIKIMLRREPCFDVYLDYLQQLRDRGEVYEKTTNISLNLLDLAHNLRDTNGERVVSITALSGVNKTGEHLGAYSIAHDAENVFRLEMEVLKGENLTIEQKAQKRVKVVVEKQRHGGAGFDFTLWFDGRFTRFEDYNEQDKHR